MKEIEMTLLTVQLPDPERTHMMWGFSKDFGLAGFRMGFIHSYSSDVLACIDGGCIFTCVPAHMQNVAAGLLQDGGCKLLQELNQHVYHNEPFILKKNH